MHSKRSNKWAQENTDNFLTDIGKFHNTIIKINKN